MGPFFSRKIFYLLWGLRPRPWAGTDDIDEGDGVVKRDRYELDWDWKESSELCCWDRVHAPSGNIYGVLADLFRHMTNEGYAPDKTFILYYLDQDEKGETLVWFTSHSNISNILCSM